MSDQANQTKKTALERLEGLEGFNAGARLGVLEGNMPIIANAINSINNLHQMVKAGERTTGLMDLQLAATINLLIEKGIVSEAELKARRLRLFYEAKKNLEDARIANKLVEEALQVGPESFLAVSQVNEADGTVIVEREHVDIASAGEEIKQLFLGKSVGEKVTAEGQSIEILRVLDPVKQASVTEAPAAEAAPVDTSTESAPVETAAAEAAATETAATVTEAASQEATASV